MGAELFFSHLHGRNHDQQGTRTRRCHCWLFAPQLLLSSAISILPSRQPEDFGGLRQGRRERFSQKIELDNKDRPVFLKMTQSVRKAILWVPATLERLITRSVEGLVKPGHPRNPMNPSSQTWARWERLRQEITTTAGTRMGILEESGATPLIQICDLNTALFQSAEQC